ncbi:Zn(2)-C6 fungal-type domain-containing protein [Mycena kentingensis (nom. inval.)]|nr:Zn(2)-C6 fungal-type domain-containing protein [Mycena kentingensis (nom. inval.)]
MSSTMKFDSERAVSGATTGTEECSLEETDAEGSMDLLKEEEERVCVGDAEDGALMVKKERATKDDAVDSSYVSGQHPSWGTPPSPSDLTFSPDLMQPPPFDAMYTGLEQDAYDDYPQISLPNPDNGNYRHAAAFMSPPSHSLPLTPASTPYVSPRMLPALNRASSLPERAYFYDLDYDYGHHPSHNVEYLTDYEPMAQMDGSSEELDMYGAHYSRFAGSIQQARAYSSEARVSSQHAPTVIEQSADRFEPVKKTRRRTKKSGPKQEREKCPLACFFCRQRKIACHREFSADGKPFGMCKQCTVRGKSTCVIPTESHRGLHLRARKEKQEEMERQHQAALYGLSEDGNLVEVVKRL